MICKGVPHYKWRREDETMFDIIPEHGESEERITMRH